MTKLKSKWICQNCGYETAKYIGKCPDCNSWGTLIEEVYDSSPKQNYTKTNSGYISKPTLLNEIETDKNIRFSTKIDEFDRVLGGGLVEGSLVLISGDPGIGKSTLLIQAMKFLNKKILYVSAEESASQIKLRAKRLKIESNSIFVYSQTNLEAIKEEIEIQKPEILIIDSIQTIYTNSITSTAGSVSQIRECTGILMDLAKNKNITTLIVGHVTKDGNIAGPKVLEHMVDTVIYFEGDKNKEYRILRCNKNRLGTTNEIGVFSMEEDGLIEILNPSELFLGEKSSQNIAGNVVIATCEGHRVLLVEVQALVGTTFYPSPRRVSNGLDFSRMLQIIAVLEKRIGMNLSKSDVYVNAIGGLQIEETACDLGIALAIATCKQDVVISKSTVIVGELGLSGEIRNIGQIEKRIKEAQKLGFERIIIPKQKNKLENYNIEIIEVSRLIDAISACVRKEQPA